jgi:hypothetical protein
MDNYLKGFSVNLPQPNIGYNIIKEELQTLNNLNVNFPEAVKMRINRGFLYSTDNRVVKVRGDDFYSPFTHVSMNLIVDHIVDNLAKRYDIIIDKTKMFKPSDFMKKGDL